MWQGLTGSPDLLASFREGVQYDQHLIQQLGAYRRKLTGNPHKQANQNLSDLDAESSATIDVVHQTLQRQDTTTSPKSSPSKSGLSSRARDLSQKAAKKVTKTSAPACAALLQTTKLPNAPKSSQGPAGHQLLPRKSLARFVTEQQTVAARKQPVRYTC